MAEDGPKSSTGRAFVSLAALGAAGAVGLVVVNNWGELIGADPVSTPLEPPVATPTDRPTVSQPDTVSRPDAVRGPDGRPGQQAERRGPRSGLIGSATGTSPSDRMVLPFAGRSLKTAERTDVADGKPFAIHVFQDPGHDTINRAQVDRDRDGTWDERWTFRENGEITRRVSRDDDGTYGEPWRWTGSGWTR
ncbi:MAG: hypothetical protein KTR31_36975 [Myxococcales bacterium]|nr:hypothetical protein [Myxococcales bacterium]